MTESIETRRADQPVDQPAERCRSSLDPVPPTDPARETLLALLLAGSLVVPQLPQLADQLWGDEIVNLLKFSLNGPLFPFTTFALPNNHMLYSALLSLWYEPGMSIEMMRLPLLFIHLASMSVLYLVARRYAGTGTALVALALFGGSWAVTSVAFEMRGYGLSLLLGILLLHVSQRLAQRFSYGAALAYLLISTALLLTLPTNVLVVAITGCWLVLESWLNNRAAIPWRRIGLLLVCPLPAVLVYLPLYDEIAGHSRYGWSPWPRGDALWHFAAVVALPAGLAVILAAVGAARWLLNPGAGDTRHRQMALLLALTVSWTVVFALVLPTPPFPRTLLAVLPLLYLPLAWFTASGLSLLLSRTASTRLATLLLLLFLASFPLAGTQKRLCGPDSFGGIGSAGLCYQPWNDNFRPDLVLASLREQFAPEKVTVYGYLNSRPELEAALGLNPQPIELRSVSRELTREQLLDDGGVALVVVSAGRDIQAVLRTAPASGDFRVSPLFTSRHYDAYRIRAAAE